MSSATIQEALEALDRLPEIVAKAIAIIQKADAVQPRAIDPLLLNVTEAAQLLGVSPRTLSGYVSARTIPHVKIEGCLRFSLDDLKAWIAQHRVTTAAEQARANHA